jgi:hypothetical protein
MPERDQDQRRVTLRIAAVLAGLHQSFDFGFRQIFAGA